MSELKTIMQQKNISQRQLGIKTNIAPQDISQALNGKKEFFPSWRKRISAYFGMNEKDVFPEYVVKHDPVLERAEKAEALLLKALEACQHCPNKDGECGKTCSILDVKKWKENYDTLNNTD